MLFMRAINILALIIVGGFISSTFNLNDDSNAVVKLSFDERIRPSSTKFYELEHSPYDSTVTLKKVNTSLTSIQLECLARNLYFEARGEGEKGMEAVAYVTMNRVYSDKYPDSICAVVYQGQRNQKGEKINCQFSWTCDGTVKKIQQPLLYDKAKEVAFNVAKNYSSDVDPTKGSLFYHATHLKHPFKRMNVQRVVTIGNHVFYRKSNT